MTDERASDANVALIQNLYAAFRDGRVDMILASVTDDVAWESVGDPKHFPAFGLRIGPTGVGEFFRQVAINLSVRRFEPRLFHAAGDCVFVQGSASGDDLMTARVIETEWAHIFTLRDGRVAAFREFVDTASYADARHY